MKQLDKLLAKSFVGPFVVTFAIALFVLLMQILWLYLDDIAGKGLSFFLIMELLAYKCVGLVPLALPLALLISSVMVLGGLAEHYELSSFKSAGVSLLRVIRMLVIFGVISAAVSYVCNDYVIPAANLQFGSRMYDIQQKKPTLNMQPGVFNEDFNQFTIRLGGRDDDGEGIEDVLIYDHTKANVNELSEITAASGQMYTVDGGNFFVMRLFNGHQYVEQRPRSSEGGTFPFMRTNFDSYTKMFDLSEFQLERHAASLFSTNRSMLSTWQLQEGVDSIETEISVRKQSLSNHLVSYLPELPRDTIRYRPIRQTTQNLGIDSSEIDLPYGGNPDSLSGIVEEEDNLATPPAPYLRTPEDPTSALLTAKRNANRIRQDSLQQKRIADAMDHPMVPNGEAWTGIRGIIDRVGKDNHARVYNRARSNIRSVVAQAESTERLLPGIMESKVKHVYDMHTKYSMAVVCIIFVFIGAPMGAIVRKGGFGYPILVSIIFFVIFIILTIFCRKLAESFVVTAAFAGWIPCLVLFPISLWITFSAMNDAKLVDTDRAKAALRRARDSKQVEAIRRRLLKSRN